MRSYKKYETEDLEKIKLKREIAVLEQPFIKKQFGSIVALVIGIASVSIGIYTGLFDVRREVLKLEKDALAKDIRLFETEKVALKKQTDSLKSASDSLARILPLTQRRIDSIQLRLKNESLALTNLRISFRQLETKFKNLKNLADSPILLITQDFLPSDISPGIILKNAGTSSIIVEEYKVYLRGKCITVDSDLKGDFLLKELNINTDHYVYSWIGNGREIAVGERIPLLGLNKTLFTYADRAKLYEIAGKILISIKYRSITGEKFELSWGEEHLRTSKCF